jgi:hypothetical protein
LVGRVRWWVGLEWDIPVRERAGESMSADTDGLTGGECTEYSLLTAQVRTYESPICSTRVAYSKHVAFPWYYQDSFKAVRHEDGGSTGDGFTRLQARTCQTFISSQARAKLHCCMIRIEFQRE